MFKKQKRKYEEMFHAWSEFVYSLDVEKIPEEARQEIGMSESDYKKAKEAFYCRLKDGVILINESKDSWKIRKDLFLSLDGLPHSLLEDIYKMESERYGDKKPDFKNIEDVGEKIRRLLYFVYMPELIKAHKESNKKHI